MGDLNQEKVPNPDSHGLTQSGKIHQHRGDDISSEMAELISCVPLIHGIKPILQDEITQITHSYFKY